jgi:hypothetical protein
MISRRLATAAAFCVLATTGALAQQGMAAKPLPTTAAKPATAIPATTTGQQPVEWSAQEIEAAQARCTVLLKGLDVVAVPVAPWREGSECGTPAPMQLISLGKGPQQVTLSPAEPMTCDLIAALYKWVNQDLQPLARKYLGAQLVRINAMSAYSCRNAYGRAKSRLSEHGRVNALDIGSFITAKGQTAMVVADWGMTAREIAAQAAAAKAAEEAKTAATAGAVPATNRADATAGLPQALRPTLAEPNFKVGIPGITIQLPGGSSGSIGQMGLVAPNRLGGPKPEAGAESGSSATNGKMDFLRAAHNAACRIFGTVLGPEANTAHKNHFHVDMAERKGGLTICE